MCFLRIPALFGICFLILAANAIQAQEVVLRVDGLEPQTRVLNLGQLLALRHQRVQESRTLGVVGARTENVMTGNMTGVLLADVLKAAGFEKLDRHAQRASAIIAIADDGYQAAFSWAEVFLNDSGAGMLVLWERDGLTLTAAEGPLALIALKDARPGPRHVKRLVALRIVTGGR